jgi:hypothetical protein
VIICASQRRIIKTRVYKEHDDETKTCNNFIKCSVGKVASTESIPHFVIVRGRSNQGSEELGIDRLAGF